MDARGPSWGSVKSDTMMKLDMGRVTCIFVIAEMQPQLMPRKGGVTQQTFQVTSRSSARIKQQ